MDHSKISWASIVLCLAEVAVGILLIIDPIGFTQGIIVAAGICALIFGLVHLVGYFRADPAAAAMGQKLSTGLILILFGAFCVIRSGWFIAAFPILSILYGLAILVSGVYKVQWAADLLRLRRRYWFIAAIGAVLTLIFAFVILRNPFATTAFLWTFIALSLILEALIDLVTLIFGRRPGNVQM